MREQHTNNAFLNACLNIRCKKNMALFFTVVTLQACSISPSLPPSEHDNSKPEEHQQSKISTEQTTDTSSGEKKSGEKSGEKKPNTRVAVTTPESVNRHSMTSKNTAASKLRLQAHEAMLAGKLDRADRLMDRALRIAPRAAENYYTLALLRLKQNQAVQAQQFARRGLSLQPNTQLKERLKQLKSEAEASLSQ